MSNDELIAIARSFFPATDPAGPSAGGPWGYASFWWLDTPEHSRLEAAMRRAMRRGPAWQRWTARTAMQLPEWHHECSVPVGRLYRAFRASFMPVDIPLRELREGDLTYDVVELRMSAIAPAYVLHREVIYQAQPEGSQETLAHSHEPSGETAAVFAVLLGEIATRFPTHRRLDDAALRIPVPGLELADGTPPAKVTLGGCLFEDGL